MKIRRHISTVPHCIMTYVKCQVTQIDYEANDLLTLPPARPGSLSLSHDTVQTFVWSSLQGLHGCSPSDHLPVPLPGPIIQVVLDSILGLFIVCREFE